MQIIGFSYRLEYIEETGDGTLCKTGFINVVVELYRLKQWQESAQYVFVVDILVGRPQNCKVIALVT